MSQREQISAEIESARAELADTVEQLTARLDPKAGLHRTIQRITSNRRRMLLIAGAATLAAVVVLRTRR
jgi:hypothetical protein